MARARKAVDELDTTLSRLRIHAREAADAWVRRVESRLVTCQKILAESGDALEGRSGPLLAEMAREANAVPILPERGKRRDLAALQDIAKSIQQRLETMRADL